MSKKLDTEAFLNGVYATDNLKTARDKLDEAVVLLRRWAGPRVTTKKLNVTKLKTKKRVRSVV